MGGHSCRTKGGGGCAASVVGNSDAEEKGLCFVLQLMTYMEVEWFQSSQIHYSKLVSVTHRCCEVYTYTHILYLSQTVTPI